jgi:uncharacterized protein (TIGR02145 family)
MNFSFLIKPAWLICLVFIPFSQLLSQTLNPLSYQFVVRDEDGDIVEEESMAVQIQLFEGNPGSSEAIYFEEHNVESGSDGKVRILIGAGQSNQGFDDIVWNINKKYFVKATVQDIRGNDYDFVHISPLLLVLPELFAGSANNLADPVAFKNQDENLFPLSIQDNKMYLSNGSIVELPEYLTNSNSLLVDVNKRNVSCHGSKDGAIDITVKGGTPPYDFYWSNKKTTEDLNNLKAGDYMLYVTDSEGYTTFKRVEITQPEPLEVESKVLDVSDIGFRDGRIALDVTGGRPPYSYRWSNGSFSEDQDQLSPGLYKVTVTSRTKCAVEKTFMVREPVKVTFDKQNVKCYGEQNGAVRISVKGGLSPYEVRWSNNGSGYFQNNLSAGKYYVFVKDSWGYTVVDSVNILQPYPLKVDASVRDIPKDEESGDVALQVSGGIPPYNYRWSTMDTTENLSEIMDGVYAVTVTDQNACESIKRNIFVYRMIEDKRDSSEYKVITIGTHVWLAENLNYGKQISSDKEPTKNGEVEKYCYNDDPEYCEMLGGLYTWDEMMQYNKSDDHIRGETQGICPDGWHLPTNDEWSILADYLGGEMVASNRMKNYDYWTPPDGSTEIHLNLSGFSALPAGRMDMTGESYYLGKSSSFWSATKESWNNAWHRTITNRGAGLYRNSGHIGYRFSVRCIKNQK